MPFGPFGFGGGYREPAPRRLTWEELLGEEFAPSPRPSPITGLGGLNPEDRRQAQMDSLFAGLAQVGAGISSGRWDRLDPGAISAAQQATIQGANARQESEWANENERRAAEFAHGQKEREAKALFGMYERVAEGETPAFQAKAETAARTGSMAELAKLDAQKGPRARMRALGDDPDKYTIEQLQERLAIELDKVKQKELLEGKVEEARQEAEARAKAEEESRARLKALGLLWEPRETPAEAAAKADAVERARVKYRDNGPNKIRMVEDNLGRWGTLQVGADGRAVFTPGEGQASTLQIKQHAGKQYLWDPARPQIGLVEVPATSAYAEDYDKKRGEILNPPPPSGENKHPVAYGLRNAAVDGLLQGGSPEEAKRLLEQQVRARGGSVEGFGAKQLLEEAKKLARRRGWKG